MTRPNVLRCIFRRNTTYARSCLRRQFHSSVRFYQGAHDPPRNLEGQNDISGKALKDGKNSRSSRIHDDTRPKFCFNCGRPGHGRSECKNATASLEQKQQILKETLKDSYDPHYLKKRKELTKSDRRPPPPAPPPAPTQQNDLTTGQEAVLKRLKPYSEEDKVILRNVYTPTQFAALEAGEEAVDAQDIAQQATLREDPMAFEYFDDFSKIHPVIDKAVKAPKENYDPKLRYKNEDEIAEDLAKFIQDLPDEPTRLDYIKFTDNLRLTVGKEEAERNPRSSLAPEIPKGLESLQRPGMKTGEADVDPAMKRLMRQTGFSLDEIRRFRVKNLVVHRVVNQTRMGKIQSMYYLTVAGNGRGLLGIGEGKSSEPEDARRQAHFNAIRNVQPIPRYEDRTIFGDVRVKIGAVELELMTRPPARGLGKKLVDVRKVYYGGQV
ncbi:hypothetical protein P7C71_g1358, partial [Lecanoromycetidae sp. Uapishka_2]